MTNPDDHDQPESEGKRFYVFLRRDYNPPCASFTPDGIWPFETLVVVAPPAWRMEPDRDKGVVLRNVWGDTLDVFGVLMRARREVDGFRFDPPAVVEKGGAA